MFKECLIFMGGAAIGSFLTWKLIDKKYQIRYEKDIKEMEFYNQRKIKLQKENDEDHIQDISKENANQKRTELKTITKEYIPEQEEHLPFIIDDEDPFIFIEYDEYTEYDGHEKIDLTLYGDNVLAFTEDDEIIDAEEYIGLEALNYLQRENVNEIYIHNRDKETDYCITKDKRGYEEVTGINIGDHYE